MQSSAVRGLGTRLYKFSLSQWQCLSQQGSSTVTRLKWEHDLATRSWSSRGVTTWCGGQSAALLSGNSSVTCWFLFPVFSGLEEAQSDIYVTFFPNSIWPWSIHSGNNSFYLLILLFDLVILFILALFYFSLCFYRTCLKSFFGREKTQKLTT